MFEYQNGHLLSSVGIPAVKQLEIDAGHNVWLTKNDHAAFKRGIRVSNIRANAVQLRVFDDLNSN
jgi:hypothetical protein